MANREIPELDFKPDKNLEKLISERGVVLVDSNVVGIDFLFVPRRRSIKIMKYSIIYLNLEALNILKQTVEYSQQLINEFQNITTVDAVVQECIEKLVFMKKIIKEGLEYHGGGEVSQKTLQKVKDISYEIRKIEISIGETLFNRRTRYKPLIFGDYEELLAETYKELYGDERSIGETSKKLVSAGLYLAYGSNKKTMIVSNKTEVFHLLKSICTVLGASSRIGNLLATIVSQNLCICNRLNKDHIYKVINIWCPEKRYKSLTNEKIDYYNSLIAKINEKRC